MACDLGFGRIEPCKDSVGGLKAVYFVNYGEIVGVTYNGTDTDVIDSINSFWFVSGSFSLSLRIEPA